MSTRAFESTEAPSLFDKLTTVPCPFPAGEVSEGGCASEALANTMAVNAERWGKLFFICRF